MPISGDTAGSFPVKNWFDSNYWSYSIVYDLGLMFALYCPIYVYIILVLYFIILISVTGLSAGTPSLNNYHQNNKNALPRLLFILTLATMLGTPPTIGFFAKLLSFYMLVQTPGVSLYACILLTLLLLIFYLQAIRTRTTLRKRNAYSHKLVFKKTTNLLIYGQFLLIIFSVTVPLLADVAYCLFM